MQLNWNKASTIACRIENLLCFTKCCWNVSSNFFINSKNIIYCDFSWELVSKPMLHIELIFFRSKETEWIKISQDLRPMGQSMYILLLVCVVISKTNSRRDNMELYEYVFMYFSHGDVSVGIYILIWKLLWNWSDKAWEL